MTNHEYFQSQIEKCDRAEIRLTTKIVEKANKGPKEPCAAYYEHAAEVRELYDFRRGAREERKYWERRIAESNRSLEVAMVGG
jgi:hypothetical protein